MSNKLLAAAIDFGTTFSSWAFSFHHDFMIEKTKGMKTKMWKSHGNTMSPKAPTSVLILPDGKTIDSFGYDAERKYAKLSEKDNHKEWYLFQQFKMQLFSKNIDRNLKLKDISGKELYAKTVFALAIKFLKDDLITSVNKRLIKNEISGLDEESDKKAKAGNERQCEGKGCDITDSAGNEKQGEKNGSDKHAHAEENSEKEIYVSISVDDIAWVITVPAIWEESAKQFMKEAAIEAGIPKDNIYIGLEPEAASIYCRFLPVLDCKGSLSGLQPGSKYMILDAGGGTVDMTVHEVSDQGRLTEKHKASGGNWGGTRVDQEFYTFLEDIVGASVWEEMKSQNVGDFLEMASGFEVKKRIEENDLGDEIIFRIPPVLQETLQTKRNITFKQAIESSPYKDTVTVFRDKMKVQFDIFRHFFDISVNETVKHVSQILKHPDVSGCKTILMVGGFSECIILQNEMSKNFPDVNIVIPAEAELSIIKGAVIFGHDPMIIAERKLKFTYGTGIVHPKGSERCDHKPGETREIMGVLSCIDIFDVYAHMGQIVKVGEKQVEKQYSPSHPLATVIEFRIYSSEEENPTFVTDDSCHCIGTLKIPVTPDLFGALIGLRLWSGFSVAFMFGGTQIKVKATDIASGKEVDVTLDCLDDM